MGIWAAALQGVMSVDSNIEQGKQERKQTEANVELANRAATDALQRGSTDAGRIRESGTDLGGQQLAAFSSSGVDASVGTPADLQKDTAAKTDMAALQVENNAAREAWGYKKHGIAFQTQAGIDSSRRNTQLAGGLLSTAGNMAGAYSRNLASGGSGWGA